MAASRTLARMSACRYEERAERPGLRRLRALLSGSMAGAAATALVLGGASVAQAATGSSWYCAVESGTPYLNGSKRVTAMGKAWGCSGSDLRLFVQVHRQEGWWHPLVAQATQSGKRKSFGPLYPANCNPTGSWKYFTQTFLQSVSRGENGSVITSTTSGYLNPCDG